MTTANTHPLAPDHPVHVRRGARGLAWVLAAIAAGVSIVGAMQGWYDRRPWFDEAVHAFSFFAFTLLLALYLYGSTLTGRHGHGVLLVFTVLCLGLALGVFWEWMEFAYDRLSGERNVIKGKFDTQVDLLMDGVGALVAGVVVLWLSRPVAHCASASSPDPANGRGINATGNEHDEGSPKLKS